MAQLLVTVDDRGLLSSLHELIERGSDPRAALERIADDFLDMEREQFATQGARGGTPWKPLSAEWTARRHSGGPTLIGRSQHLEQSLTRARGAGTRRRIDVRPGRTAGLEVGSTQALAHLHQGGTGDRFVRNYRGRPLAKPRYAGRLPARPVVAVTERDEQRWRGILTDHIF